jgi:3-oxoacyl-(acyl-carrier-protein) synthase
VAVAADAPFGSAERVRALVKETLAPLLDGEFLLPEGTDLVVATTKGAVDELSRDASPLDMACQPWNLAGWIAELLKISGRVSTVSGACASGTIAIVQACQMISSGSSGAVLVAGIDILSNFVQSGFASLKALSGNSCHPFDSGRDGLAMGEAMGALLIVSDRCASENRYEKLAVVSGMAVSCDAVHITAPCRKGSGLVRVLEGIFHDFPGKRPGAINAHGTGTRYNDAMELAAFTRFWEDGAPPVHSVKGSLGHCLGAAGVTETAIALKSLHDGVIPPTYGFRQADAPFAGDVRISGSSCLKLEADSILSCNSGFGGINAGILLEKTIERRPQKLSQKKGPGSRNS